MKGVLNNIMQFFNQNDYSHHLRQINIFKEQYMTGVRQSNQYVFSICWKKKPNAVYNAINIGFGIRLVYVSHRKSFFHKLWYTG